LLALILIGAKSNKDPRGFIQNGWWGIKFLAIIGIMVAAFFIPNATFIPFGMTPFKRIHIPLNHKTILSQ
jgi:hypothetical protein